MTSKTKNHKPTKASTWREWPHDDEPVLRFSPTAWAKLLFFRDRGPTEIGGFGITARDDLLYVQEFVTVKQQVTATSVSFDDNAVADFYDVQVDQGLQPEQFGRIWLHTHPAGLAGPSGTDEETFARVFGTCDWAVMFILAQSGETYARLRFGVGPGGDIQIPVEVDFHVPFGPSDVAVWQAEYDAHVFPCAYPATCLAPPALLDTMGLYEEESAYSILELINLLEPDQRQIVMRELAARPDWWADESEVNDVFE